MHIYIYVCGDQTFIRVFMLLWGGIEQSPVLLRPLAALLYHRRIIMDYDECGAVGRMFGRRNRSTRRKRVPSTALFTTNPT
jgi:hypothetical protein